MKPVNILLEHEDVIAVISNVILADHETLRKKIELALREHYDGEATVTDIPQNISTSYYPAFNVPFKMNQDGVENTMWEGELDVCCVHIY